MKKRFVKIGLPVVVVILVVLGALGGGGWYLSDVLRDGGLLPDRDEPALDLEVVALSEGRITLRTTPETDDDGDWRSDGIWGLESDAGYDQVGLILEATEGQVVREFIPLTDDLTNGEMVRLDSFAFPDDPRKALGIPFEDVSFSSPLGEFPAWLVDGTGDTWAIFVHGRGANRREALRMLPAVAGLGLPCLVITYRNDLDAPASEDGMYRFGLTEWEDVEGAARYATENGAEGLVLVGYSMGGGIVTSFLYESTLAERVRGAILDAPMLDFGATVDLGARLRGYPGFIATIGKIVSGFRFDVDWKALDYLKRVEELTVPILLFHGDADERVPLETSDALAEARSDIVEYVRIAGAGHVRVWNKDPAAYEEAVSSFIQDLLE